MNRTILDTILDNKVEEVARIKKDPSYLLEREAKQTTKASLKERLDEKETLGVIAEIKRASPSKGIINGDVNPVEQAKQYESNGASAISVLTDEAFFKGSMEDLTNVAEAVSIPVLCKDFIIDEVQLIRAKKAGASIVLLIVAALDQVSLQRLYNKARELTLEVLVEVHNEEELERALAIDATIIGVNNRNLKTFEVDLAISKQLAEKMPLEDIHFISESGILTAKEASYAAEIGASGVLVGEVLMRAANVSDLLQSLQVPRKCVTK